MKKQWFSKLQNQFAETYELYNESQVNDAALDEATQGMSYEELETYLENNVNTLDDYCEIKMDAERSTRSKFKDIDVEVFEDELDVLFEKFNAEFDNNGDYYSKQYDELERALQVAGYID